MQLNDECPDAATIGCPYETHDLMDVFNQSLVVLRQYAGVSRVFLVRMFLVDDGMYLVCMYSRNGVFLVLYPFYISIACCFIHHFIPLKYSKKPYF